MADNRLLEDKHLLLDDSESVGTARRRSSVQIIIEGEASHLVLTTRCRIARDRLGRRLKMVLGGCAFVCAASFDYAVSVSFSTDSPKLSTSLWTSACFANVAMLGCIIMMLKVNHGIFYKSTSMKASASDLLTARSFSKITILLGDSLLFFGASSFSSAIQHDLTELHKLQAHTLGCWLYTLAILFGVSLIFAYLHSRTHAAVTAARSVHRMVGVGLRNALGGESNPYRLSWDAGEEQYRRSTLTYAEDVSNINILLSSFLRWTLALALNNAVHTSLINIVSKAVGSAPNALEHGPKSIPALARTSWLYAAVVSIACAIGLALLSRGQARKVIEAQEDGDAEEVNFSAGRSLPIVAWNLFTCTVLG
jgi:hypothetical protein